MVVFDLCFASESFFFYGGANVWKYVHAGVGD